MIDVCDLSFSYNTDRKILGEIAFDAKKGECIAILGNNGAGKSTLIKCLNRILAPQCGTVIVDGGDVRKMNRQDIARHMAYVSQKNDGDRMTVFDAILLGRKPYIKLNATDEDLAIVSMY
jgi:iron complex transport system ATP-binding protein